MTPRPKKEKLKVPRTAKDWAILWCELNRWEIFPYTNERTTIALGAMKLCEKFCTEKQIHDAWNRRSR